MTRSRLLGAALVLSAFVATPALAQRMIEEPGMFAFTHPNGDLGIASIRPAADARASVSLDAGSNMARVGRNPRHTAARRR
jgi:hypothetical protein